MDRTKDGQPLKEDLSNYDITAYEKPSVTVDVGICTIKDNDLKVLLIKRRHPPYQDFYAIPGGFLEIPKKESLEETADRELLEETNIKGIYFEQLKTYGAVNRDPRTRVITVAYFALSPFEELAKQDIRAGDDAKEEEWVSLKDLPPNLAFDHREILNDLLARLKGKISYTPIAFHLVDKCFTWTELQKVYEIILDRPLDAGNFRKKIESMYFIEKVEGIRKLDSAGRPPALFQYLGVKDVY